MSGSAAAAAAEKYVPKPPKAVQAQIDNVEQIIASQSKPGDQPPATPPAQPPVPPIEPPATPPPATPPAQPPAPPAVPAGNEPTWEQRARSAEGRMEQVVNENRAMSQRMSELEALVARMQASGATATPPAPPPAPQRLITPEEETEYGAEMLTVVGKRAREEFIPELSALQAKIDALTSRVDGTVQIVTRSSEEQVYDALNNWREDWRQINKHPQFIAWLGQIDPFAGRSRKEMLQEAFARHDARRVLNFFQGFAEAAGLPATTQATAPATPPVNGQPAAPSLEDLAAPGRARSAPQSPVPPEKPTYTSAQITKFYADQRTGKYKGREAEASAIERDIYQAQHEGRIIG